MHWAADLIGRPYRKGAECQNEYDCWSMVRHVFATRHGIILPVFAVGDASANNVAAIKRAAAVSGWCPVDTEEPEDGDIVLMLNAHGERHVGVMVEADGLLGLLHCIEGSGVCFQSLADLSMHGFRSFEPWRRAVPVGAAG